MGYLKDIYDKTVVEKTAEDAAGGEMERTLKAEYLEILKKREWCVSGYTNDGRVDLQWFSPAGEDFGICVSVENFPRAVFEAYDNFDIDEHIELWIEAKRSGTRSVPSVRRLVIDAEAICDELEALAGALLEVDR